MIDLSAVAGRVRVKAREHELRAVHESDQGDELAALAFRMVSCALYEVADALLDVVCDEAGESEAA